LAFAVEVAGRQWMLVFEPTTAFRGSVRLVNLGLPI